MKTAVPIPSNAFVTPLPFVLLEKEKQMAFYLALLLSHLFLKTAFTSFDKLKTEKLGLDVQKWLDGVLVKNISEKVKIPCHFIKIPLHNNFQLVLEQKSIIQSMNFVLKTVIGDFIFLLLFAKKSFFSGQQSENPRAIKWVLFFGSLSEYGEQRESHSILVDFGILW